MRILSCLLLFGALLAAQTAAPPEVDQALRARIQTFYQAHVDGKFRVADQVVAEDSKDFFFEMDKKRYLSFEVARIDYSEDFTRATATVNAEAEMVVPMIAAKAKIKVVRSSLWKLVDGQWWWYTNPSAGVATPFGVMNPGTGSTSGSAPGVFNLPKGPAVGDVQNAVKAEKTAVQLTYSEPSSDVITLSNRLPGGVSLTLEKPDIPGLEFKFDRAQIAQNESARLTVSYMPKQKGPRPPAKFAVIVEPTEQVLPFQLTFVAPEKPAAPAAKPAAKKGGK